MQGNEDIKTQDLKILSLEIKIKMLKLRDEEPETLQIPIITWTDHVFKKEVLKNDIVERYLFSWIYQ